MADAAAPARQPGHAPPLQAQQGLLLGYLSSGYGFNAASVSQLLSLAEEHFQRRSLEQALECFGAAYELGRLSCNYRPLLHDLLLRRVLCLSMLGRFREALSECEAALTVLENSAFARLVLGLVYCKLGGVDGANTAFQAAAEQRPELRGAVEALVALFELGQGEHDRAIEVCGRVLKRAREPFALLVRGDCFKFHPSGLFKKKAVRDYAELLELDRAAADLAGEGFSSERHARAEELLLRFCAPEPPKSCEDYALFGSKAAPLAVTALVVFAAMRFKGQARQSRAARSLEVRQEEMLRQRAAAEHRLMSLAEAQRRLTGGEVMSEIWGPARPGRRPRTYRRYWMERPLDFPRRRRGEPAAAEAGAEVTYEDRPETPEAPCITPPRKSVGGVVTPSTTAGGPSISAEELALALVEESCPKQHLPKEALALLGHRTANTASGGLATLLAEDEAFPGLQEALEAAERLASAPAKSLPVRRPRAKVGERWSEEQWLRKAHELLELYPVEVPPPAATPLVVPEEAVAEEEAASVPLNLVAMLEDGGSLPEWYPALDRIWELSELRPVKASAEPPVPLPGLASVPGHSYVVPSKSVAEREASKLQPARWNRRALDAPCRSPLTKFGPPPVSAAAD